MLHSGLVGLHSGLVGLHSGLVEWNISLGGRKINRISPQTRSIT